LFIGVVSSGSIDNNLISFSEGDGDFDIPYSICLLEKYLRGDYSLLAWKDEFTIFRRCCVAGFWKIIKNGWGVFSS